jgi:tetratricopeptide (TPR) repeat protein
VRNCWLGVSERDDTEVEDQTQATKREGLGVLRSRPAIEHLDRGGAVGRYIVIDVIGAGGMGVVYSAFDPVLDRKIALKLLQASPATGGGDQAWLLREAQAMARLAHPNVIAVHDVGTLPGDRVFVAMELVDGATLRAWLRETKRSWREVLPVMLAAGAGLAAAHAGGLVHRDFKPDNVLVGNDGRVRVMDFGLARLRPDDDSVPSAPISELHVDSEMISTASPLSASLTVAGTLVGTPAYMAPELREGHAADARSDQFSFGVALYEALYRTRPFAKDAPRGTEPMPPPDLGVPARIQRVVMRALSLKPDGRFASVDELLRELAVDVMAPRRRALIAVGATLCMSAAIVGGFVLSSRSSTPAPAPCMGIDRRLAGVWDAASKQTIRVAFEATKRPFAAKTYAGLERAVDVYAGDWTAAAVESCEATRVRGEQTEEVLSLRTTCLDQRLEELRAITQLLANADQALVERADKIAFGLEPVSRCANVSALRAPDRPPTEPKHKVDEMHALLATAKAELLAGRYFPSMNSAVRAGRIADEIGYEPSKAEAMLVQAASLVGAGNVEAAVAMNTNAVWVAMRGRRDDLLAAAGLSTAIIASQRKVGEARIWIGLTKAAIARLGRDQELEHRALQVEGLIAAVSGDVDTAIALQQQALAAAERFHGVDNPKIWSDVEVIGVTYAKAGAYDKARPFFERALKLHEAAVGPDHPDNSLILTNLGACYSHAGDSARARATYERALAIRERIDGAKSPMLILTLNNMSDGLVKAGDASGALLYIERAKELAHTLLGEDNALYHAVVTTRAETLAATGRTDEARREYDYVLGLEAKQQSPYLGPTLNSRAKLAIDTRRWAEAASFAQRAITAMETAGGNDAAELWQPLANLGRAYVGLGRSAEARPVLERALAIGEKAHLSDTDLAPLRALLEKR